MAMFSRQDEFAERTDWFGTAMSVEEYHQLEHLSSDRTYEYIHGKVYMMSGGSVEHDRIRRNIESTLERHVRSRSCEVFGVDVQVALGTKKNGKLHYVSPDTTVSCHAADWRRGNTLVESPCVVVEVLSPGTETKDRGMKFKAYQRCPTIQEIVLVNQYFPSVEVWRRNVEHPDNSHAWLHRHYGPHEMVELPGLDLQLAMEDIYRNLHFEDMEEDLEQ
ncbi:MAG TPA: Uma2 family endonuclease [Ktedonobacteraceae bacterium]